ncbi:MAG: hypothetical protein J6B37_09040 [Clostridia bacterium]|nr:hypothetical protein [Clostridia bacterium]MBR3996505.1 hypothetical protein [Clostridia bacterium]
MITIERIDEELVVVKIPSGELKICPLEIFPDGIKEGDRVSVEIVDKSV